MKRVLYLITALFLLVLFLPFFIFIYLLRKLIGESGQLIFSQKRAGKNKKPFKIYKLRTMIIGAENLKSKFKNLNEANGPVFKIYDDPRYTKLGKFLAHSGLDELPQLINVIKGEMDFVGPRPFPMKEAKKIPKKYERRFSVLPGMTSPWVTNGASHKSFNNWMELDLEYVAKKSLFSDLSISIKTVFFIIKLIIKQIINGN
ncbi:MAG: sugar transferase [Patescibacteria group bacterium]